MDGPQNPVEPAPPQDPEEQRGPIVRPQSPLGEPPNPVQLAELIEKFRHATTHEARNDLGDDWGQSMAKRFAIAQKRQPQLWERLIKFFQDSSSFNKWVPYALNATLFDREINAIRAQYDRYCQEVYKHDKEFECGICCEDFPMGSYYVNPGDENGEDAVCRNCYNERLRPMFIAASKNKSDWPVTWGTRQKEGLYGPDFPELPDDFKEIWDMQVEIYNTEQKDLIFCEHFCIPRLWQGFLSDYTLLSITQEYYDTCRRQGAETSRCGAFLGFRPKLTRYQEAYCKTCEGASCTRCGTAGTPAHPNEYIPGYETHECDPSRLERKLDIDPKWERGKDYQICPKISCKEVLSLHDGCNTLVCTACRTSLCYICGVEAEHDSDHWSAGKPCPRWNQPGAPNAFHDMPAAQLERLDLDGA